jgi:DNA polymerase
MFAVSLPMDADEAAFRAEAKRCLAAGIAPRDVTFRASENASLLPPPPEPSQAPPALRVSRAFAQHLTEVACHSASDRFDLLYELVWRMANGEPKVMERTTEFAVNQTLGYARAVRRDIHKMHAFLRFREHHMDGAPLFVAWFEPQHHILKAAIPFFVERFASMHWLIATPAASVCWKDRQLTWGPGGTRPPDVDDGVLDLQWTTYYRTIFNPGRLHVNAMLREMPRRYWQLMPETRAVPELLRQAGTRAAAMIERPGDDAPRFAGRVAERRAEAQAREAEMTEREAGTIDALRTEAEACTRCPLYRDATQTVFGEGPPDAQIMLVGEQPGDQEDIAGKPFVGPAGRKLDAALADAGIDRRKVYITNAVKHFKFEPRGKRRIHSKPNAGEIEACRFWIEREIALVKPGLIVALGATAAQSLTGRAVGIMKERGRLMQFGERRGLITVHPSFLLRLPDPETAKQEYGRFVGDLRIAAQAIRAQAA